MSHSFFEKNAKLLKAAMELKSKIDKGELKLPGNLKTSIAKGLNQTISQLTINQKILPVAYDQDKNEIKMVDSL